MGNSVSVLTDLDELIGQAEELQDYCSETGPNDAMRLAVSLKNIRTDVDRLIHREQFRAIELNNVRGSYMRLIDTLAAIHMRCAPNDITTEDGRVMRFVPPDPEFYWRELSASIRRVESDMRATFEAEDAAARVNAISDSQGLKPEQS